MHEIMKRKLFVVASAFLLMGFLNACNIHVDINGAVFDITNQHSCRYFEIGRHSLEKAFSIYR